MRRALRLSPRPGAADCTAASYPIGAGRLPATLPSRPGAGHPRCITCCRLGVSVPVPPGLRCCSSSPGFELNFCLCALFPFRLRASDTASPMSLIETSHYKYVAFTFESSSKFSDDTPAKRHKMKGAYVGMPLCYYGLTCTKHVRLQLRFITTTVCAHITHICRRTMGCSFSSSCTAPHDSPEVLLLQLNHACVSLYRFSHPSGRAWSPVLAAKVVAGLHSVLECADCLALPLDDLYRIVR